MTLQGHVKGGVIVLDGPVVLPEGTAVKVEPIVETSKQTLAEQFSDFIGAASDLPQDMAEHHDHYIRGTPKQ